LIGDFGTLDLAAQPEFDLVSRLIFLGLFDLTQPLKFLEKQRR
jgi:hypothetical protein